MKLAKITLIFLFVIAAIGGGLAFKAKRVPSQLFKITTFNGVSYCTTSPCNSTTGILVDCGIVFKSITTTNTTTVKICINRHLGPAYSTTILN